MASRTKRTLIGCGIGCGSLILLVVIGAIAFGAWIGGKGELLEPQRLLGADTTGYAEWTLRLEDPGTEGFVQLLIEALEAERAGRAQRMPDWMRQLILNRKNRNAAEEIRQLFPVVVAWTMAPSDEAGRDEMLFTLSPTGMGNRLIFADWMVGFAARWSDDAFAHEYHGEKIYKMPSGSGKSQTFFLRAGTIFFTSDMDAAKVAVDRLLEADRTRRRGGPLDLWFAETPEERPLRGALSNERGEVPRLWKEIAGRRGRDLMEAVRGATLEGGLRDDGSFVAALRFRGPNREWATTRAEQLRDLIAERLSDVGLDLKVSAEATGDVVRVEVRAEEIIGNAERWLEEQERRSGIRIDL